MNINKDDLILRITEERGKVRQFSHIKDKTIFVDILNFSDFSELDHNLQQKAAAIILGVVPLCKECGNLTKFMGSSKQTVVGGWKNFCSVKCSNQSEETKQKRKLTMDSKTIDEKQLAIDRFHSTMKIKYGGHSAGTIAAKEKSKMTNLVRYGVDSFTKTPEFREKIKNTSLEKYGVDHHFKADNVREKIKNTNLKKYGFEHCLKSNDIREKIKNTNLEKYGVENVFSSNEIQNKIKKTNLKKYGCEHIGKSKEIRSKITYTKTHLYGDKNSNEYIKIKQKRSNTNLERYGVACNLQLQSVIDKNKALSRDRTFSDFIKRGLSIELSNYILDKNTHGIKIELEKLINENGITSRLALSKFTGFHYSYMTYLIRVSGLDSYFPQQISSNKEKEVFDFVKSLCDDSVQNDRSILNGKELDVYIPSKKLAIEFNGMYWHSVNNGTEKSYHLNKTEACENRGIQLLHIFESEWDCELKQNIWKSIIKAKLGLFDDRFYARKCDLFEIDNKLAKDFLIKNHLQGFANTSKHMGLFYCGELVSVMSYGKSRFKSDELELIRFATKINTQVVGGFSKLLKYIGKPIISFADRRYSSHLNSIYASIMKIESVGTPSFWVYVDGTLKHRLGFQKHLLKNKLNIYDENKTAMENLLYNKIIVIHDCGNYKYSLNLG